MASVMMRRSNGFLLILLALLALRLLLHEYVGALLPPKQTAAIFFILAFGMILRWRTGMYLRYRAIRAEPNRRTEETSSVDGSPRAKVPPAAVSLASHAWILPASASNCRMTAAAP